MDIDLKYWENQFTHPDWYIRTQKELEELFFPLVHDDQLVQEERHKIYDHAVKLLSEGKMAIADQGPNLDSKRESINTIVIHHTEEDPDTSAEKISAIGLLRLYAPKYLSNDVAGNSLKGFPIWSGHFKEGAQVFYGYHWLVKPDGTVQRLLEDRHVGFHSGEFNVNVRSIGIALAGNYEHGIPPMKQIIAVSNVIKENYSQVRIENIVGHLEVKSGRTCPGDRFLSDWKQEIVRHVAKVLST